jgi:pimeloyl-ACP methyl ester carboxylesterase
VTAVQEGVTAAEQSRARYPDADGYVEREGVRIFYEVYGTGEPTVLLLPTWSIVHSRHWKAQIPYLARHFRVVTFDGRGNGRSDRPAGVEAYAEQQFADDALAVMGRTATERAVLVGLSAAAMRATMIAAERPERVSGIAYLGPSVPLAAGNPERDLSPGFEDELDSDTGWAKYNRHYWLRGEREYRDFLEFFFSQMFNEPHSTKQIEDCVGWGLETDAATLADTASALSLLGPDAFIALAERVRCPTIVIHGDRDRISPHARGSALAELTGGTLVTLEGAGHGPQARDPVKVNLLLREFIESLEGTTG